MNPFESIWLNVVMKINRLFTPTLRSINLSYLSVAVVYLFPPGFILLHCSDLSSVLCWCSLPSLTYVSPPCALITQQNLRFSHVRLFIYSSPSLFNLFPHLHVFPASLFFLTLSFFPHLHLFTASSLSNISLHWHREVWEADASTWEALWCHYVRLRHP